MATVAASPNFTRPARNTALQLERELADELDAFNRGEPMRTMVDVFRPSVSLVA